MHTHIVSNWLALICLTSYGSFQKSKLPEIIQKCQIAGTESVEELSTSMLYQMEPNIRRGAHGALWIPGETVVDPWLTAVSFAHQARLKGATVCRISMAHKDL